MGLSETKIMIEAVKAEADEKDHNHFAKKWEKVLERLDWDSIKAVHADMTSKIGESPADIAIVMLVRD